MVSNLNEEIEYAKKLYYKRYLPGNLICIYSSKSFNIYKDNHYKINRMSFLCSNNKCINKYIITINFIFNKFSNQKL